MKKNAIKRKGPIVLTVLDGWGEWPEKRGNALAGAKLPTIEKFNSYYPKLLLQASGLSVGLPWGVCGNSEVGHQTMGTGRIFYQDLPMISMAIENGSFFKNEILQKNLNLIQQQSSAVHVLGLLSDGAVHSDIDHLFALIDVLKKKKMKKVFFHLITDGRDVPAKSAEKYLEMLEKKIEGDEAFSIVSMMGRYYAMDRNKNWDRTEKAYRAMAFGEGIKESSPQKAIENQYKKGITDEFFEPTVFVDENGSYSAILKPDDLVIFFNYRSDRAKQITKVFTASDDGQVKVERPKIRMVTFTRYEDGLPVEVIFDAKKSDLCLSKIFAEHRMKQLRIAETEKHAHVTYFFNGGSEKVYEGEDRILVPSKKVKSYDQLPEMSAEEVTDKLLLAIASGKYDFLLVNYANPDMVGHTGNYSAAVKAVEFVDKQLERLTKEVFKANGTLLVTADHGNVEEMVNLRTGEKDTEHSSNPVPFWLIKNNNQSVEIHDYSEMTEARGMIADIAPTILGILGIEKPKEMTGESLLELM